MHWGTFNLAIHAWDEPAETLLALAPKRDTQLVMPRHRWWRAIAALEKKDRATETAKAEEGQALVVGEPID